MEELQKSKSDFNTALEELWEREKQIKVGLQIIANSEHLSFTVSQQKVMVTVALEADE